MPVASAATGPGGRKWRIGVHPHQPSVIYWPPSHVRRRHLLGSLPLRVCAAISVGGVPLAPLDRRCNWLAGTLGEGPFLMGERYTIADPYLFTVLNWTSVLAVDLGRWPALKDYLARVGARPAVQETLKAEGLTG